MNKGQRAAIILAAGSSLRMCGVKKEFQKLTDDGLTVLCSAVSAFTEFAGIIIIVIPENEEAAARAVLPPALFANKEFKISFVIGGDTRRASVYNALRALEPFNPCYVLIHDGARPWVSRNLINNIIEAVKKHDAVIPLLPLTDTPKLINREQEVSFIKTHLKRDDVGCAQTPQAFKFPEILYAHDKAAECNEEFTDDAEIWGRFIGKVVVIPGEQENKKITYPEDLS